MDKTVEFILAKPPTPGNTTEIYQTTNQSIKTMWRWNLSGLFFLTYIQNYFKPLLRKMTLLVYIYIHTYMYTHKYIHTYTHTHTRSRKVTQLQWWNSFPRISPPFHIFHDSNVIFKLLLENCFFLLSFYWHKMIILLQLPQSKLVKYRGKKNE